MGQKVRLIPPIYVKLTVKRGKNDAAAIEPRPWRGPGCGAGQEQGATSDIDAAQDTRAAGQAADHGHQRLAWPSFRVRHCCRQGNRTRPKLICKRLDLRFQTLPDEITACHSSLGGEFGEWIDVVKDAIGRSKERPSQATGYGTSCAGASEARVLDNIESTSPIMPAVE
jgi:hypothetical protein